MNVISLPRGAAYISRAEDVYPTLESGSVSMVWSDGPYAVGKDTWDRMKPADLPAWYEPHIQEWSRICAPSATIYHWGTAEGEGYVREVYRRHGWTFRGCITWDKGIATLAGRLDTEAMRMWPDVTEVCGFWQREPSEVDVWNTRGESHPVRLYLAAALAASGLTLKDVDARLGVSDMARHWFTWSQWCLPSEERYRQLQAILPGLERSHDSLKAEAADVWQQHREDWEALRAPFTLPPGVTNVWRDPVPQGGVRLDHPCQKPLSAVRRAILASTRPGDTILDPFAGTCRVALACEQLHADQARRHTSIEMDPAHVKAALRDIDQRTRQGVLF